MGYSSHSFGIGDIGCELEGTLRLFATLAFLLWNIVWLYDLVTLFKQTMYARGKHMCLQLLFIYGLAIVLSLSLGAVDWGTGTEIYTMVCFG
jgi:hypothetical protein